MCFIIMFGTWIKLKHKKSVRRGDMFYLEITQDYRVVKIHEVNCS